MRKILLFSTIAIITVLAGSVTYASGNENKSVVSEVAVATEGTTEAVANENAVEESTTSCTYVDENKDGICDNFGSEECVNNGECDGTGSKNGNGACDGTGSRNGNGVCDGTGSRNRNAACAGKRGQCIK